MRCSLILFFTILKNLFTWKLYADVFTYYLFFVPWTSRFVFEKIKKLKLDCSIISSVFCLSLLSLHTYPSSPPPYLGNHWTFYCSIVLPFPEYHLVRIIQCIAFSDWFLSLPNMHLSFLHVFSWLDSSFLFSPE